jgi:hypothetical protein
MIDYDLSDPDGIIVVTGTGLWTIDEVTAHYGRLRAIIAERRSAGMPIRVLSDVRQGQRQSPEIEAAILQLITETYLPGDRIAILTGSEVDKAHVRSVLGQADVAAFQSRLPAEMWLMTDDLEPPR